MNNKIHPAWNSFLLGTMALMMFFFLVKANSQLEEINYNMVTIRDSVNQIANNGVNANLHKLGGEEVILGNDGFIGYSIGDNTIRRFRLGSVNITSLPAIEMANNQEIKISSLPNVRFAQGQDNLNINIESVGGRRIERGWNVVPRVPVSGN